jgi:hypothetical protein
MIERLLSIRGAHKIDSASKDIDPDKDYFFRLEGETEANERQSYLELFNEHTNNK